MLQKWDHEVDVIVIGAGNAGFSAAITAAEKNVEVLIEEVWSAPASSLAMTAVGPSFGGTLFQKAQGIEDSPDEWYKDGVEIAGGDPKLWRVLADKGVETYEWLNSIGIKTEALIHLPGHRKMRSHMIPGSKSLKILENTAKEKGVEILYEHRAERLLSDPNDGRVIGVKVRHQDKILHHKARRAIIITTGGFGRNKEMVKEYGPRFADCIPIMPLTHMGDGLRMALAIGAATRGLGLAVSPSGPICEETKLFTILASGYGAILVNKNGKRFSDEAGIPYSMTQAIALQQPEGLEFIFYDEELRRHLPTSTYAGRKVYKGDTVEEVAKVVGIDPEGLKQTIDKWNNDIEMYGYDTIFSRKIWGGLKSTTRPPKFLTPPFYIIKCRVSFVSTKGGLKINEKAQVVNQFGEVIPSLYAAGEVAGGFQGKPEAYLGGMQQSVAYTYGRIAGENAAKEKSYSSFLS